MQGIAVVEMQESPLEHIMRDLILQVSENGVNTMIMQLANFKWCSVCRPRPNVTACSGSSCLAKLEVAEELY